MLKVAGIQFCSEPGNVKSNVRRAVSMVNAAVEQGARLVVLPELWPYGYNLPGPVCPVGGNSGRGRHGDVPRPCAETGGRDGGAICRESESPFVHCGGRH